MLKSWCMRSVNIVYTVILVFFLGILFSCSKYQKALREAEDYKDLCEVSGRFVSELAKRFATAGLNDVAEALGALHGPLWARQQHSATLGNRIWDQIRLPGSRQPDPVTGF